MTYPAPGVPYPDPGDLFINEQPRVDANALVLPRVPGSPGGLIEAVKRAVVTSVRAAVNDTTISSEGNIYVDIEYPMKQEQYPGIWVNFSINSLVPAGMGQEEYIDDGNGNFSPVKMWTFQGRVTLDIAALTARDRDRLADRIIMLIAFARPPDLGVIYKPSADTKQDKTLMTALLNNPYVAMTMSQGAIIPGGQQAQEGGLPWQNDVMIYEDSYGFDVIGQFTTKYDHDGAFVISAFKPEATMQQQAFTPTAAPPSAFGVNRGRIDPYYPPPPSPYEYQ